MCESLEYQYTATVTNIYMNIYCVYLEIASKIEGSLDILYLAEG